MADEGGINTEPRFVGQGHFRDQAAKIKEKMPWLSTSLMASMTYLWSPPLPLLSAGIYPVPLGAPFCLGSGAGSEGVIMLFTGTAVRSL